MKVHKTPEAAAILGLRPRTLERMRLEGRGPTFCKHGRIVVYHESDLIAWSEKGKRTSTSDLGGKS